MTLYEIDDRLVNLITEGFDSETGEILEGIDLDKAIDECQMDLNTKISNIGCFIKNLLSDAEQLKVEKQNLEKRQKQTERKAEYLKNYLDGYLHSVINEKDLPKYKFSDARCQISYRKSEAVEITDLDKVPKKFIKDRVLKESDVDKAEIKKLLKADSNTEIEGTQLIVRENIQIK